MDVLLPCTCGRSCRPCDGIRLQPKCDGSIMANTSEQLWYCNVCNVSAITFLPKNIASSLTCCYIVEGTLDAKIEKPRFEPLLLCNSHKPQSMHSSMGSSTPRNKKPSSFLHKSGGLSVKTNGGVMGTATSHGGTT